VEKVMIQVTIKIKGLLDKGWADWFNGLEILYTEGGDTIIIGIVSDTAAFQGMLGKINNLGLEMLLVVAEKMGT